MAATPLDIGIQAGGGSLCPGIQGFPTSWLNPLLINASAKYVRVVLRIKLARYNKRKHLF